MLPKEKKQMAFLGNLFWRPSAYMLTPKDPFVFSTSVQKIGFELRENLFKWRVSFNKNKPQEIELKIPRDIL